MAHISHKMLVAHRAKTKESKMKFIRKHILQMLGIFIVIVGMVLGTLSYIDLQEQIDNIDGYCIIEVVE